MRTYLLDYGQASVLLRFRPTFRSVEPTDQAQDYLTTALEKGYCQSSWIRAAVRRTQVCKGAVVGCRTL